jgi:hypothetical protein
VTTGTFGGTTAGTSPDASGAGYKFGSVYTLTTAATAKTFKWYARGGTASQTFRPLIYSVNGAGQPTTLVVQGPPVTVAANQPAGWVAATLPAGITLQSGNYMLALLSGPTGSGAFTYYDNGAANASYWNNNGSTTTATAAWGALNSASQQWSFYVEYETTGPPAPPVNTALPAVNGSPVEGQTLTSTTGTWTNNPTTYAHQWQRCDANGAACGNVTGATNTSYVLTNSDVGSTIAVRVTASNGSGSTPPSQRLAGARW